MLTVKLTQSLQPSQSRIAKSKVCSKCGDNGFALSYSKRRVVLPHRNILMSCSLEFQAVHLVVWTETWSFYILHLYSLNPAFSKNLGSHTCLPSYLLQLKAPTSLNNFLCFVSSFSPLLLLEQRLSEHVFGWSETDPCVSKASCKCLWCPWFKGTCYLLTENISKRLIEEKNKRSPNQYRERVKNEEDVFKKI